MTAPMDNAGARQQVRDLIAAAGANEGLRADLEQPLSEWASGQDPTIAAFAFAQVLSELEPLEDPIVELTDDFDTPAYDGLASQAWRTLAPGDYQVATSIEGQDAILRVANTTSAVISPPVTAEAVALGARFPNPAADSGRTQPEGVAMTAPGQPNTAAPAQPSAASWETIAEQATVLSNQISDLEADEASPARIERATTRLAELLEGQTGPDADALRDLPVLAAEEAMPSVPDGHAGEIYFAAPQSLYDEVISDEDGDRYVGLRHSTLYMALGDTSEGLVVSPETAYAAAAAAAGRYGDEGYGTRWEVNRDEGWIRYHQADVPGSEPFQLIAGADGAFVLPREEFHRVGEDDLKIADSITNTHGVQEPVPSALDASAGPHTDQAATVQTVQASPNSQSDPAPLAPPGMRVTINGNLAAEPTYGVADSGRSWARLRVASNERVRGADGGWTDAPPVYTEVVLFGARAENAVNTMQVGDPVLVKGRPEVETFARRDSSMGAALKVFASSVTPRTLAEQPVPATVERAADRTPVVATLHHTPTQTVAVGVARDDKALQGVLKDNGFKWSAKHTAWYLPASMPAADRDARVAQATAGAQTSGLPLSITDHAAPSTAPTGAAQDAGRGGFSRGADTAPERGVTVDR